MSRKMIEQARKRGQKALSEYESKQFLKAFGVPVTQEVLTQNLTEAKAAAKKLKYPVVVKACSPTILHKTEKNLVRVGIRDEKELAKVFKEVKTAAGKEADGILIQEMVKGARELIVGLSRDPQFGPCVMFGLGGIFTEVLKDVSFRVAPLEDYDAADMLEEIRAKKILDPFRGEKAADRKVLKKILRAVGQVGLDFSEVSEIDINPLIIRRDGSPVAVDALVSLTAK